MVTYMFKKLFKKIYLKARSNRNDKQYWTINKYQNGTDGILVCTYVQYRWIESIFEIMNGSDNSNFPLNS